MVTDRVLVAAPLFDALTERLVARAAALPVGDPRHDDVAVGPLITDASAARFADLISDASAHGARVLTSGTADGRSAKPTVLTGVSPSCRLSAEEAFAAVVSIEAHPDDAALVAAATDSACGLTASVVAGDPSRAWDFARRLRCGAVHVNAPSVGDEPHVPFGGLAASGYGRLGGAESVQTFTEQPTFSLHGTSVLPAVTRSW